jgi:peptide/nickel transport system substrate-binding protein
MSADTYRVTRRAALKLPSLSVALNAVPAIAGRAAERVLRYAPYSNLIVMDPVWSISIIGLEHAFMTCDQLYGLDEAYALKPQMVAGHELTDRDCRWVFSLREGLVFHNGEKVRAIDCVASILRWSKRDPFGLRMATLLDDMKALDDMRFEIRLKRPYAHLLYGLGATTCFIRPEDLAQTDISKPITDQIGSGPFRFLADEFISGAHAAYARHSEYVPRQEKPSSWAGGKQAYFDRVEWKFLPDPATAAAALQTNEIDWLERPLFDLVPKLRSTAGVSVTQVDPLGNFGILWLNDLSPPFDNVKLRHALLPAVNQSDFMAAVVGQLKEQARTDMGMFTPGSPFASDVGMGILNGPRDPTLAKKLIADSGYKGEKIVLMLPEIPEYRAMGEVSGALMQQLGLNVETQSMDWGTLSSRARSKDPKVSAGWGCYCVGWAGLWPTNPGSNIPLSGVKPNPAMEALRSAWFDATDFVEQKRLAERMQMLGLQEPPFIPLGQYFIPYAYRTGLTDFVRAPITAMWGVRRT